MNKFLALVGCVLVLSGKLYAADRVSLGKYTLAPGEKKTISIEATKETKVGFDSDIEIEQAKTCVNGCIKMWIVGKEDMTMASAMGGSLGADPVNGKIAVVFENVEKFPIPIDTFSE